MKRPMQHVMEDESEACVRAALPKEWVFRNVPKDYGVDLEIELVDQEIVTGKRIWVQLKSTTSTTRRTVSFEAQRAPSEIKLDGRVHLECISFSIATNTLEYALGCPFPLLLFVVDLSQRVTYWLPLRDEVEANVQHHNPRWLSQAEVTVHIPVENTLTREGSMNYSGLRWYAMEPSRMYAFARLHRLHHELQYKARLSGYRIGDGDVEGEEGELRASLELAREHLRAALQLDVLFGVNGIDYFKRENIDGLNVPGIGAQLQRGVEAAETALQKLDVGDFGFADLSLLIFATSHAVDLMSTAISSYHGFATRFLVSEGVAVWRAFQKYSGTMDEPWLPFRQGKGESR